MNTLKGKTLFITGGSRGIGRAIALRAAQDGANIVIAAKSDTPNPKLEGTIYSVADEIKAAGGQALALKLDVRDDEAIKLCMEEAAKVFGGIDILVNNASAISLTHTADTPMKRYDLMMGVNGRATFACSQAALPYLKKSSNPHILTLSPPLNMQAHWFKDHVAYTMSKYTMSMCTLGMSAEFKSIGIAVNSLWPKTIIHTAAIEVNFPKGLIQACRKPEIVADAAHVIFCKDAKTFTGQFCVDEIVLREEGITDFSHYAVNPEAKLHADLFLTE